MTNFSKPIRFREQQKTKEVSLKEMGPEIKMRSQRMLGYAGRALINTRMSKKFK